MKLVIAGVKIRAFLRPGILFPVPAGIVPDKVGAWGLFGLMANSNQYAQTLSSVATAGTNVTLTSAQLSGVTQLNTGASAGFTITLPSSAAIIAGLPSTIPLDGSYSEPIRFVNNNIGQTGTLTAGDGGSAIIGTATIATNTARDFLMQVLNSSSLSFTNIGSLSL